MLLAQESIYTHMYEGENEQGHPVQSQSYCTEHLVRQQPCAGVVQTSVTFKMFKPNRFCKVDSLSLVFWVMNNESLNESRDFRSLLLDTNICCVSIHRTQCTRRRSISSPITSLCCIKDSLNLYDCWTLSASFSCRTQWCGQKINSGYCYMWHVYISAFWLFIC